MGSTKDQRQRRGFSKEGGVARRLKKFDEVFDENFGVRAMKISVSEFTLFPVWSYVSEMAGVSAAPKSPESSCGLNCKYKKGVFGSTAANAS